MPGRAKGPANDTTCSEMPTSQLGRAHLRRSLTRSRFQPQLPVTVAVTVAAFSLVATSCSEGTPLDDAPTQAGDSQSGTSSAQAAVSAPPVDQEAVNLMQQLSDSAGRADSPSPSQGQDTAVDVRRIDWGSAPESAEAESTDELPDLSLSWSRSSLSADGSQLTTTVQQQPLPPDSETLPTWDAAAARELPAESAQALNDTFATWKDAFATALADSDSATNLWQAISGSGSVPGFFGTSVDNKAFSINVTPEENSLMSLVLMMHHPQVTAEEKALAFNVLAEYGYPYEKFDREVFFVGPSTCVTLRSPDGDPLMTLFIDQETSSIVGFGGVPKMADGQDAEHSNLGGTLAKSLVLLNTDG